MLTLERLKELFYYHPSSGDFVRLQDASNTRAGEQAGSPNTHGYLRIMIDGVRYPSHRLAVFYMTGVWPHKEVDHRDTVKWHNWWSNLRHARRSQNRCNQSSYKNNKLGLKNIYWYPRYQKYKVSVQFEYERTNVGYFENLEDAVVARDAALKKHHGQFARVA